MLEASPSSRHLVVFPVLLVFRLFDVFETFDLFIIFSDFAFFELYLKHEGGAGGATKFRLVEGAAVGTEGRVGLFGAGKNG
jgi:hypothetical protein